ncbi:MAG TPA: S41 family peptidase [Williamwhitmania sp.]|nr:S41 family peptidase [Williamwhitmania sp.]
MNSSFKKGTLLLWIFLFFSSLASAQGVDDQVFKFSRFLRMLSGMYIEPVNDSKLVENAIVDILGQLDPHSAYISKDDVAAMNEPLEGNFDGIGIEFNIFQDTLIVVNPVPGGPSEKVGLVAGDRIISVDGKNIAGIGLKNSDVFKLLRGPKGTKVQLVVARKGSKDRLDFLITRDKIPIYSIDAAYMAAPKVAYIKISRFALSTVHEFLDAWKKLKPYNPQALILDLRGNGGGYLNTAIGLSDQFLPAGKLILYTEGANSPRFDYTSTSQGCFEKGALVVLIDEGSASASEITSGAIQDWDRGIIIGRRSFGKGLVQTQLPLPDGSMVRLTVARYHTPTGRVIQRPYKDGNIEKYYQDFYKRYTDGEMNTPDSIHFPDSLKYYTLEKKRPVYGGGGIMPDIFVPVDTTFYSDFYGKLVRKGLFYQFVISYMDQNRKALAEKYPTFASFKKGFSVDGEVMSGLLKMAKDNEVTWNDEDLAKSGNVIKLIVKGLIAQQLFTTSEYFEIVNEGNDPTYAKALDVIANWKNYKNLVGKDY